MAFPQFSALVTARACGQWGRSERSSSHTTERTGPLTTLAPGAILPGFSRRATVKKRWVVTQDGTIFRSDQSGVWTEAQTSTKDHTMLRSTFGTPDGAQLWAVGEGGTILESIDGEHWHASYSGVRTDLMSVSGTSDASRIWTVGEGVILKSTDGENWSAINDPNLRGLFSIRATHDGRQVWAVGLRGMLGPVTPNTGRAFPPSHRTS